jgi:hypothetical protein
MKGITLSLPRNLGVQKFEKPLKQIHDYDKSDIVPHKNIVQ